MRLIRQNSFYASDSVLVGCSADRERSESGIPQDTCEFTTLLQLRFDNASTMAHMIVIGREKYPHEVERPLDWYSFYIAPGGRNVSHSGPPIIPTSLIVGPFNQFVENDTIVVIRYPTGTDGLRVAAFAPEGTASAASDSSPRDIG